MIALEAVPKKSSHYGTGKSIDLGIRPTWFQILALLLNPSSAVGRSTFTLLSFWFFSLLIDCLLVNCLIDFLSQEVFLG